MESCITRMPGHDWTKSQSLELCLSTHAPVKVNPGTTQACDDNGLFDHTENSDNSESFQYHSDITNGTNRYILEGDSDRKLMKEWGVWQTNLLYIRIPWTRLRGRGGVQDSHWQAHYYGAISYCNCGIVTIENHFMRTVEYFLAWLICLWKHVSKTIDY